MAPKFNKYEQPAYWTQNIQFALNGVLHDYLKVNNMTQKDFADKLGVSKGYVSQILNGNFDHKLSKLVELALACGMVPKVEFVPADNAQQVVKQSYLSAPEWKSYGEYNQSIVLDKLKLSRNTESEINKIA